MMERVDSIYRHPLYQRELQAVLEAERDREFCRHDLQHFLDVARVGWILCLERELSMAKDMIYAAALLHDIGRGMQYRESTPHDAASAMLARQILPDCGFTREETEEICGAIEGHRLHSEDHKESTALGALLKEADHASRCCFACEAEQECYWPKEKKNLEIRM